jgi:hypothetical protein
MMLLSLIFGGPVHGIIMTEFKKFALESVGASVWGKIQKVAGNEGKIYLVTKAYPDEEFNSLISMTSSLTFVPVQKLLEGFGEFMVPGLVQVYKSYIKPDWKTLDLLEMAERSMHKAARLRDPDADPPALVCQRLNKEEVMVTYSSERRLCSLAMGIAKGIAKFYGENISLEQPQCMHRGDRCCQIHVKLELNSSGLKESRIGRPEVLQPVHD